MGIRIGSAISSIAHTGAVTKEVHNMTVSL